MGSPEVDRPELRRLLNSAGEAVVTVWCDGLECRDWGPLRMLKGTVRRAFLGTASMLFRASDRTEGGSE